MQRELLSIAVSIDSDESAELALGTGARSFGYGRLRSDEPKCYGTY